MLRASSARLARAAPSVDGQVRRLAASGQLRRDLGLFWVSCLFLFFEILMIRWLSAELRILSYFHNLVLLFAFLGMGLGLALASRAASPLVSFAIATGLVLALRAGDVVGLTRVTDYLSIFSPDFVIWGGAQASSVVGYWLTTIAGILLLILLMLSITIFFVPFGQIMGRLFGEYASPLRGYGVNLAGSLAGIWLFNALSFLSLPPAVWIGLGGLGALPLIGRRPQMLATGVLVAISVVLLYEQRTAAGWNLWSPYQKLTVVPAFAQVEGQTVQYGYGIFVNSVGYQAITNYSPEFTQRFPAMFPPADVPYDHYNVAYRFAQNVDEVLIIGAGAGNDASSALRNGAQRVTAVEIDPSIIAIGRELHPEVPYDNPRVTVVNDDARSYFKKTDQKFDLVVFGFVDSHTLSSSYSNVRLDNYLYTVESFREARGLLKPDGVLVVLFWVADSDNFIHERIDRMLTEAFRRPPVGFPVRWDFLDWRSRGFAAGDGDVIGRRLASDTRLRSMVNESPAAGRAAGQLTTSATDDWPYLYLQERTIPLLYFLVFALLMAFSVFGVRIAYGRLHGIDWHFFFLGAGFLLMEVQNVSKLTLLFGTTWVVNATVISAILVTIMAANVYVARVRIHSPRPYYVALFLSLLLNYAIPLEVFGALAPGIKDVLVGAMAGIPFFFAGMVFSGSFATAPSRTSALASNLLGATAGGMLEALSFVFGIRALLIVGLALYVLAAVSRWNKWPTTMAAGPSA